jgi:hypothetical protein
VSTEWQDSDEVTTTYATIKQAAQENFDAGVASERARLIKRAESYFELTQWSTQYEGGQENPEWGRGYQAAMAILKGGDK